jgi:alpha-galactosidase
MDSNWVKVFEIMRLRTLTNPPQGRSEGWRRVSCGAGVVISVILAVLLLQAFAPVTSTSVPLMPIASSSTKQAGQGRNFAGVVDVLPPYQLESGLVTRSEVHLAERWREAVAPDNKEKSPWLDQWLSTELPFSFRYDGKGSASLLSRWPLQKQGQNADPQQEFIWTDAASGLRITWRVRRFGDYPAVEWVLTFENTGASDTPILEDIQALNFRLNHSRKGLPYRVHGIEGGRSLPDDMTPFSWVIPSAYEGDGKARGVYGYNLSERQLGGDYPSSNRHLPFFNLETPERRGVLVGVGWSGNWLAQVKVDGTELNARTGLKESHFILHAGEKVRTPRILLLFWQGERLHGNNMLRQLLYSHYIPRVQDQPHKPLVSVNVCFTYHGHGGFLHEATEQTVLPLVQPFTRIGAEVFIIDAGWYEGAPWDQWMGNWRYSKEKYPRGLRPISKPLAASNTVFGIWFASEHVSPHAPVLKEHPEWVRQQTPGNGGTLRMELPEAREWFLRQVDDLVENEGMSCYRQDGAGGFGSEPDSRKGITESQHIAGLYTLWDTLLKRHPNLVMEGCSGGGRRIDLETLSRFHWHQKADRWYDTESDQCSLYGANLYLPGGVINIPTEATDDYGAWSSFAGQFCLGWHPLDKDFPTEQASHQVERYKRIRPLLSGDFYPLTPCSLEEAWIGYQFHRVDWDKGFVLLFRRSKTHQVVYPASDTFRLSLRGLDPQSRYRLHFERRNTNEVLTGDTFAKSREIIMSDAPAAEMIIYERVE